MMGFKPETFVIGSNICIMNIVYTVDDFFYLRNNISDFSMASWEAPIMNFSKALGGNFSNSILSCEIFAENFVAEAIRRYKTFN